MGSIIPGIIHHHNIGRMHLMRRGQPPARQDCVRRFRSQRPYIRSIARPAKTELMRAASTAEKAVRDAVQQH